MPESSFDLILSIVLGIVLAASTGFRVFVPALIVSGAAYAGYLPLDENMAWLGTSPALTMLAVAALVEIVAYYVPGLDNLLDALATPAALVAGTVLAAAVMVDLPPIAQWTAAIVLGGGAAGVVHGVTSLLRANSTAFTAGLGNPVVATGELGGAVVVPLLALAAPFVALALVLLLLWAGWRLLRRNRLRPRE